MRSQSAAARLTRLLPFAFLLIGTAAQVSSIRQESQTYDEAAHIVAGYSYWRTGDFRLNPEHPPLSKLISTLTLLPLPLRFEPSPEEWANADEFAIGRRFVYANTVAADTILLAARSMTIATTLLCGVALTLWTRRRYGSLAACVAAALFAFDPLLLAHGRYVTSDLYLAFFYFGACAAFIEWLETGRRSWLIAAALATGGALASKYSGVAIFPAIALLWWMHRPRRRVRQFAFPLLAVAFLVVWSVYGFDVRSIRDDPRLGPLMARPAASGIARAVADVPVPAYYWLRGLHLVSRHHRVGHPTYFLGRITDHGSRLYFAVVFLVKTPIGLVVLTALALVAAVRRHDLRILLAPAGLFFAIASASTLNLGARHILPVYPFLCAAAAACASDWRRTVPIATLAVALESSLAWPHYTSFFNAAAGGMARGHRYVVDSNVDWGQDLKRLGAYLRERGSPEVCLEYFGTAPPEYYGIRWRALPPVRSADDPLPALTVISAHRLWEDREGRFSGLRARTPDERIGTSLLVFKPRPR